MSGPTRRERIDACTAACDEFHRRLNRLFAELSHAYEHGTSLPDRVVAALGAVEAADAAWHAAIVELDEVPR